MRRYIANLHRQPDEHKNRVALLTSATVTLFIFAIWSFATFGVSEGVVAQNDAVQAGEEREVSPLESFRLSVASSIQAIKESFGQLKNSFSSVDFESEYSEMRDNTLEIYGQ